MYSYFLTSLTTGQLFKMEELSDDGLTWEERYYQADAQLQKFRQQAGRVRELLNQKVYIYFIYLITGYAQRILIYWTDKVMTHLALTVAVKILFGKCLIS